MKTLLGLQMTAVAIAMSACSTFHLVHRGSSLVTQANSPAKPVVSRYQGQVARVVVTSPGSAKSPGDPAAAMVERIVSRVAAAKRNDLRIAIPQSESASVFERRLSVLFEDSLTKAGFRILPALPPTAANDERAQLAVLNVEATLIAGNNTSVQVIARVIDRADIVLACVETLSVSPKELSTYLPAGSYLGQDQSLHEAPVKNFKIIRGE